MQQAQEHTEETLSITVWLSGRSYRIRIKPEEESAVRKAVKLADQKVMELRTHYAGKDDQDFMAMCLLSYAADAATDAFSNPLMQDELNKLSRKIDKVIGPAE
jgi:cell division protein ZapA (FtsZ GTPase activity inhibitor)